MLRAVVVWVLLICLVVTGCSAPAKRADWSPTADPNWANEPIVAQELSKPSWWEEHPWVKPTLIGAGVGVATFMALVALAAVAATATLHGG
jgi:hypothetical protein